MFAAASHGVLDSALASGEVAGFLCNLWIQPWPQERSQDSAALANAGEVSTCEDDVPSTAVESGVGSSSDLPQGEGSPPLCIDTSVDW